MKKMSVAEAKARFSECVELAEDGDPVVITRHGKSVAAVISVDDLKHVQNIRTAGPEQGLASIAGGWKNSDELVKILENSKRTKQRFGPDLD